METLFGATPVKAIRVFRVDTNKNTLRSLAFDEVWNPGEIKKSKCLHIRIPNVHSNSVIVSDKPEVHCTCGIWSCKNRKKLVSAVFGGFLIAANLRRKKIYVTAQIEQWGRVIEHADGYRSEYARIIPETISWWPRDASDSWGVQKKYLLFLRKRYGAK
jgi:hypothetical protein